MKNETKKGYLMIFLAGMMWGTLGLFTTLLSGYGLSAPLIAFLRLASGVIILGVLMLIVRGPAAFRIDARGLLWCALFGVFAEALQNAAYAKAVSTGGMAVAAVLLYTAPVYVSIMSAVFFKEKMSGRKITALAVNIAGCVFAVTGGSLGGLQIPAAGVAAGLAAGFFFATQTIISSAALKEYDPLTVLFYGMLIGAVLLGAVSRPWAVLPGTADPKMFVIAAVFGLVPTCIAYIAYMNGMNKNLEASRVPVISSVEIVVSALVGTLVLSQDFSAGKAAGIVLIMLSIVIMNMNIRRPVLRRPALPRISMTRTDK